MRVSINGSFDLFLEFPELNEDVYSIKGLIIKQKSGLTPPIFELNIELYNQKSVKYLNEDTIIKGAITDNIKHSDLFTFNLKIQKLVINRNRNDSFLVNVSGFIGNIGYLEDCKIEAFEDTSKNVLSQAKSYLKDVIDEALPTNDKQVWIRHNIPPISFFKNVLLHSYINENNILLTSIDLENKLYIRDLETEINKARNSDMELIWYQNRSKLDKPIYMNSFKGVSNFGVNNSLGVYETNKKTFNLNTLNESELSSPSPQPSLAGEVMFSDKQPNIELKPMLVSDEVHENYHKAKMTNTAKMLSLKNLKINVGLVGSHFDLYVNQVIYFNNFKKEDEIDLYSGYYLITEITYKLIEGKFQMILELTRESYNEIEK